ATDPSAVKRFLREARLSSRLAQSNIVSVYDFGQTDRVLYLAMELLHGRTLHDELEGGAMPAARVVRLATQLCDALEAARDLGIVRRGCKPGCVILVDGPAGRVAIKVLDFGLAKSGVHDASEITHTGLLVGTPLYMAPEQAEHGVSDVRSDLYALGCIVYE